MHSGCSRIAAFVLPECSPLESMHALNICKWMISILVHQGAVTLVFDILPSPPDPEETTAPKPLATPSAPSAAGPAHGPLPP